MWVGVLVDVGQRKNPWQCEGLQATPLQAHTCTSAASILCSATHAACRCVWLLGAGPAGSAVPMVQGQMGAPVMAMSGMGGPGGAMPYYVYPQVTNKLQL